MTSVAEAGAAVVVDGSVTSVWKTRGDGTAVRGGGTAQPGGSPINR